MDEPNQKSHLQSSFRLLMSWEKCETGGNSVCKWPTADAAVVYNSRVERVSSCDGDNCFVSMTGLAAKDDDDDDDVDGDDAWWCDDV
jgi:hypothetical protein